MIGASVLLTPAGPALAAPPGNDLFANAATISGEVGRVSGTIGEATREPGEPGGGGGSVWYRWVAPETGRVWLSLPWTTGFPAETAVYVGDSLASLSRVAFASTTHTLVLSVERGVAYSIQIQGPDGTAGAFGLDWYRDAPPPANDAFSAAKLLTGTTGVSEANNLRATEEPFEPEHDLWASCCSVWFTWRAPATATFSFAAEPIAVGGGLPTVAVYTGDSLVALTLVTTTAGEASFPAVAGQTYRIAVADATAATLAWGPAAPPNDHFADATVLSERGTLGGSTRGASAEPGEPLHASLKGGSVWYRWTAPYSATASVDTLGSAHETALAVYVGDGLARLTRVAETDDFRDPVSGEKAPLTFGAVAGTTYYFAAAATWYLRGDIVLNWKPGPRARPANDDFSTAAPLASSVAGTNVGATREGGEPAHAGRVGGASVWYRWTASATAPTVVTAASKMFGPDVAVYRGTTVSALTPVGSADATGTSGEARVEFAATAGTTYYVAVDGHAVGTGGEDRLLTGSFTLSAIQQTTNDYFAAARELVGPSGQVTDDNRSATREPGEPRHGGGLGWSLWYRWTPATDGVLLLHTTGSAVGTTIAAYTGSSVSALTPLGSVDAPHSWEHPPLRIRVRAGVTYRIAVDSFWTDRGQITLHWARDAAPNDNWIDMYRIGGPFPGPTQGEALGSTHAATKEPGEANHAGDPGGASIWYQWIAPREGRFVFETTESTFDTLLAVYRGDGSLAAADDDGGGNGKSRLVLDTGYDQVYRIAVDGKGGARGDVVLRWRLLPPPNDAFAAAPELAGSTLSGWTSGSTYEGAPARGYEGDVWYRWRAPATGVYLVRASNAHDVSVYAGTAYGSLQWVSEGYEGARFGAVAGQEYRIAVHDSEYGSFFDVSVGTAAPAPPPNDLYRDAQPISGWSGSLTTTGLYASRELGEPESWVCSAWYRWTAPSDGVIAFDAVRSTWSEEVGVYSGPSSNAQYRVGGAGTRVAVRAGDVLQVAPSPAYCDSVTFSWRAVAPGPANDRLEAATTVVGTHGRATGTTESAGRQPGEPADTGNSVWYRWTPPASGRAVVDVVAESGSGRAAVYAGSAIGSLAPVQRRPGSGDGKVVFTAVAGQTYSVAAATADAAGSSFELSWALAPVNDEFASAATIAGQAGSTSGRTLGAGTEAGEPHHSGNPGGASVWYRWTAPATGSVIVDTIGSDFDTLLGVYTGGTVGSLQRVEADDQTGSDDQARAVFQATAGVSYAIAVDGYWGDAGLLSLRWRYGPANDALAGAERLGDRRGRASGTTTGATAEAGEPRHAGAGDGRSIWYRWRAGADGVVVVDTVGSSFDTVLAVYRGSAPGSLTPVEANDDADGETSRVLFTAEAGVDYAIAVDGTGGESGRVFLNWAQHAAPPHDDFADAHVLAARSGWIEDSNLWATAEPGERRHAAAPVGGASVWYRWTAPDDGPASIDVSGVFEAAVAVYTGDSAATLVEVASSRTSTPPNPPEAATVSFPARRGVTYHVAVDSDDGTYGSFDVVWNRDPHDEFTSWPQSRSAAGQITGTTIWAGRQPAEPVHGPGGSASVWLAWEAPVSGRVVFDTLGSSFDSVLAVYSGDWPALQRLGADDDSAGGGAARVAVTVARGARLMIAVDGKDGARGPYALNWRIEGVRASNDDFAAAVVLEPPYYGASYGYTNHGATHEPGEPAHAEGGARSVWFRWTAPSSGVATASASSTEYQSLGLAVYTGASLGSLVPVTKTPIRRYHDHTDAVFKAAAGTTYQFAVEAPLNETGDFGFRVGIGAAPANDDFARATAISGTSGTAPINTIAASREAGEPGIAVRTVWYRWRPASGRAILRKTGFSFGDLALYRGAGLGSLTEIPSSFLDWDTKAFRVDAGSEYWIAAYGNPWGPQEQQQGTGTLSWELVEGDYAAGPRPISGATGAATGSNVHATREGGEPAHAQNVGGRSLWFSWTAPASGNYAFSTAGSAFDTTLAVYRGAGLGSLSAVAANDDEGAAVTSRTIFAATAGTTFLVALDGYSGASGSFNLAWAPTSEQPTADTTPPTAARVSVSSGHGSQWSNDRTVDVTWTGAEDSGSGVDGYSYDWTQSATSSPDTAKDAEETAASATSPPLADGEWWFHLRVRDNAGNWSSATHVGPFRIDGTAPAAALPASTHPPGWSNDATVDVTWSGATDAGSGVDGYSYSWSQAASESAPATKLVEETVTAATSSPLGDGRWWFHLRSRDSAGNWSETVHAGPFDIDATPAQNPTLRSPTHAPGAWSNVPTVEAAWDGAVDAHSGVDGFSFDWTAQASSSPDTVKDAEAGASATTRRLDDGDWWFHLRTRDAAGNWSPAIHLGPFRIDTVAPTNPTITSPSHQVGAWSNDPSVVIEWTAEVGSAYSYEWSSTEQTEPDDAPEPGGTRIEAVRPDGVSWFHLRARTDSGTWSQTSHVGPFLVDTARPETTITSGPDGPTASTAATFEFAAEAGATFECSLDGGPFVRCASPATYEGLAAGTHLFRVRATDRAGNVDPTAAERQWTIEAAAPPSPQPPSPVPSPPPSPPPPPPARVPAGPACVVPRVVGKTLRSARSRIAAAGCRVGPVSRAYSTRVAAGRVVSQRPRPGARLRRGTRIALVLSRGRAPRSR